MNKRDFIGLYVAIGLVLAGFGIRWVVQKWNKMETLAEKHERLNARLLARGEKPLDSLGNREAGFPGGNEAFAHFVQDEFEAPEDCDSSGGYAKVLIRFYVDTNGMVKNAKAEDAKGVCPEFVDEAIRVVTESPKWQVEYKEWNKAKAWRMVPIMLRWED